MKSFLGLKAKAGQAVKERLDQAKARNSTFNNHTALQRPFDSAPEAESSAKPGDESRADGGAHQSPDQGSRSTSPAKDQQSKAQGPGLVDPVIEHLLQKARSEAVRQEFLQQSAATYTTSHHLKLLAGTYNVNGRQPPPGIDLRPWLDVGKHQPDLVAVAFQEIVPLNAQNVVMGTSLEAASAWDRAIDTALNGLGDKGEGHLVAKQPSTRLADVEESEAASGATSAVLPSNAEAEASVRTAEDEGEAATAISNEEEQDDLEGYLSPAEDTASILSDDFVAAQKPYVQMAGKQMVGVYLSLWVKRALLRHVRGVQVTSVGTGIMGYLGNKGAVAVRLRIFDSGMTVIAAHLSSGEQEGDELKRNYDYSEIVRRGAFPPDAPADQASGGAAAQQLKLEGKIAPPGRVPGQWGPLKGLLDTELVLWMGDLNYRLTMPDAEARAAIKSGKLAEVAEWDELVNMIRQKRAFQGWQEGSLSFPPTFKFKRGTDFYLGDGEIESEDAPEGSGLSSSSTAPSIASSSPGGQAFGKADAVEKKRTPAWTDRILWRPCERLRQLSYSSSSLQISDHKPVMATFSLVAREYLRDRVEVAVDTARRIVDAREMAAMPRCELDPIAVDAGMVLYAREKVVHLILRNCGLVKAKWQLMSLPGIMFGDANDKVSRPAPRWAVVTPTQGVLQPGEAAELLLSIRVDGGRDSTAELLQSATERKLDVILVFRVEEGNDIFCSVAGRFSPSFFGLPIPLLNSLPRPLTHPEAWRLGSAKLRINTQKQRHQRERPGSDGAPADFYSPMSSFQESPQSSTTADTEASKSRRPRGNHSVGSEIELESASISRETPDDSGEPAISSAAAPLPRPAGLSSVDQVVEAFGNAKLSVPPDKGQGESPPPSHLHTQDSATMAKLLPPELGELTNFLYENDRLQTPGLFVNGLEEARAARPRAPCSKGPSGDEGEAVTVIRESLDRGQGVPSTSDPHDVAATVLAFFCALPQPFMPHAAAQICDVCPTSKPAAASLLADALDPADLAVFQHITGLLRDALAPHNSDRNGLTKAAVARLFAEVWFEGALLDFRAESRGLTSADALRPREGAGGGSAQVTERRSAFIATFLEGS